MENNYPLQFRLDKKSYKTPKYLLETLFKKKMQHVKRFQKNNANWWETVLEMY